MKTLRILAFLLICGFATNLNAAELLGIDPGALQKHSGDVLEYYELKKKLEEQEEPKSEEPLVEDTLEPSKGEEVDETKVSITSIVTDKSQILTEAEINGITGSYEGKTLTIADLFAIVDRLNDLYRAKGVITAKAVLPPQKVEGGVVRIRLIEGSVGKVLVEGNSHTWSFYLAGGISLEEGDLVELERLKRDLTFFNAVNDVKLRVELKPGEQPGQTDLVVKAEEPQNYEAVLMTDNAGTKSVGRERVGVSLSTRSLQGFRDPLTLSGFFSRGSRSGSAAYSFPVTHSGTRFGATYDYNEIEVQEGPFAQLDVGGDSYNYSLSLNHQLFFSPVFSGNVFGEYRYKYSTTDFDGVTISETNVASFPVGFDFQYIDEIGLWYNRNSLTYGTQGLGGDSSFVRFNTDLLRSMVLAPDVYVLLRGNGQLSSRHPLPSTEQFVLGGLSSVRGFPEGYRVGDEGYFVSAELKFPLFKVGDVFWGGSIRDKLTGVAFIDHGGAFPYRPGDALFDHEDFLTSGGVGLGFDFSQYLSGKVELGVPIAPHGDDVNSVKIHFSLKSVLY